MLRQLSLPAIALLAASISCTPRSSRIEPIQQAEPKAEPTTQPAPTASAPAPRPPAKPTATALRERAEVVWKANSSDDWKTSFQFEDPEIQAKSTVEDFIKFKQEKEPLKIESYRIGEVFVESDFGWVEVDYKSTLRKMSSMPPREAKQWQKWRVRDGEWYPVQVRLLEYYPETPKRRDAAAEALLRERFIQSAEARAARDWQRLYEFADPNDRPEVPFEKYSEVEGQLDCPTYELRWVEVIGESGRVQVVYTCKTTDPSRSKEEARPVEVTERWLKVGDEWYRDLKRKDPAKESVK